MSKTVTFEAWAVLDSDGCLMIEKYRGLFDRETTATRIADEEEGEKPVRVRVTVETIEEGEEK